MPAHAAGLGDKQDPAYLGPMQLLAGADSTAGTWPQMQHRLVSQAFATNCKLWTLPEIRGYQDRQEECPRGNPLSGEAEPPPGPALPSSAARDSLPLFKVKERHGGPVKSKSKKTNQPKQNKKHQKQKKNKKKRKKAK